jgi:hypothetical protein
VALARSRVPHLVPRSWSEWGWGLRIWIGVLLVFDAYYVQHAARTPQRSVVGAIIGSVIVSGVLFVATLGCRLAYLRQQARYEISIYGEREPPRPPNQTGPPRSPTTPYLFCARVAPPSHPSTPPFVRVVVLRFGFVSGPLRGQRFHAAARCPVDRFSHKQRHTLRIRITHNRRLTGERARDPAHRAGAARRHPEAGTNQLEESCKNPRDAIEVV